MAINPGTAFGGNALATPQPFSSYQPPPSGPNPGAAGTGEKGGGAGGAYDMHSWERKHEVYEDLGACLGVDVGTTTIKVRVYVPPRGGPDMIVADVLDTAGHCAIGSSRIPPTVRTKPYDGVMDPRARTKVITNMGLVPQYSLRTCIAPCSACARSHLRHVVIRWTWNQAGETPG